MILFVVNCEDLGHCALCVIPTECTTCEPSYGVDSHNKCKRNLGATPYPFGPDDTNRGYYNFYGNNFWTQVYLTLHEGNIFEYNCQRFNRIFVSVIISVS